MGLVAKKQESHVKDSIDSLLVVQEDGIRKVCGIEMKARVTGATQQASLQHAQQRMIEDSSGTPNLQANKYVVVNAINPDLQRYVEKLSEAIQILHHAYTYQFDNILLLIGNQRGEIISGVWVRFGWSLLNSYGEYLRHKYQFSTQWMYDRNVPQPPSREIEWALNESEVTEEEFNVRLEMWQYVMTKVALPLPPLVRVIPYLFSTWNGRKVGSDTITYLVDRLSSQDS